MRKLVIGMALASTALATPALARQNSWYVEIDGGAMIVEDTKLNIAPTAASTVYTSNAVTIDNHYGYDFGGIVGYDFGGFRLEAEASYRKADPDNLTATIRIPAAGSVASTASGIGSYNYVAGDASSLTFMVNGMLDFGPDDGLQGFIGGGVGVARVKLLDSINSAGPGFINDSDTRFAWQALAGIRAPLSDHWDVGVKYRFLNTNKLAFNDTGGRPIQTRWRSHSLLGTFTYNFGGRPVEVAPPPPPPPPVVEAPPPPPPPPPPVVQVVCNKGPYIVFFDWDKSDVTAEAATILDSAITAYGNCDRVPIMLAGYADRSGSTQYNQALSGRRNTAVRGYLTSHGIADAAITSQAFGESNPRVPTADGVRELQNRRVEITYGPGSGM